MLSLHRWAFFIPMCIVTSGAFVLSLYYPRTYSATTSFERHNDPILADLPMSQGAATFKLLRTTIAQDLTSVDCMLDVVDSIGLTKNFDRTTDGAFTKASHRRRTILARSLATRISITTDSPNERVDKVRITYMGPDPTIGKKLLDGVKATYIRRTMDWIQEHLEGLRDYYKTETELALQALRKAEREQTRLRLAHPYVNPQNPESITTKLAQQRMVRDEWEHRRREYSSNLEAQRQMLASVEAQLAMDVVSSGRSGGGQAAGYASADTRRLRRLIKDLGIEITDMRASRGMTDAHPEMRVLLATRRKHLHELEEQQLRDQEAEANGIVSTNRAHSTVPADIAGSALQGDRARTLIQIAAEDAKVKECNINLESIRKEMEQLTDAKDRIFELQEGYANITELVATARTHHRNMAGILAKIEPAIRVNQQNKLLHWSPGPPASGAPTPVNPKSRTVLLLSMLAGIAAGVIFVVLSEILDHVYRSSTQVARSLGLPLLEAIDEIVTGRDRRRLLIHHTVTTPLLLVICLGVVAATGSMAYLSIERPHTYERIQRIPQAAVDLLVGKTKTRTSPIANASIAS